ncbi:MAG: prolyl oligopeptidase family serine peptidase [Daejeonella sp.]|uniref:carboxylesterase family protein n=1 Tax=Daejeonella sp. TaxID=2805397 RepID=UPI003C789BC8
MKKFLCLALFFFILHQTSMAQNNSYTKEAFVQGTDTLLYRLLLPENFDPAKEYPVLFVLHGAGERGNNNEAQLTHGGKLFQSERMRKDFPAIVVFPQCPTNDFWANVQFKNTNERFAFQKGGEPGKAMKLLIDLVGNFRSLKYTDNDRFYVGGLSMGGMGTLEILRRKPRVFAAAFAICGGDNVENVKKYKKIPLWFFHGEKDNVVPVEKSKVVVAELQRLNAPEVKLTLYPEANHNSWDPAFAEPELLTWLFSHRR